MIENVWLKIGRMQALAAWGAAFAELHDEMPRAFDCSSPVFQAIVAQLASQLDLSIFDIEIFHHQTRAEADLGAGKASKNSNMSVDHLLSTIASLTIG